MNIFFVWITTILSVSSIQFSPKADEVEERIDGSVASIKAEALREVESFYGQLYTSVVKPASSLAKDPRAKLTRHYTEDIPHISLYQIGVALKQLKNNKAPDSFLNSFNPYKNAVRRSPLMRQRAHGYLQVRPGVHLFYQLYYANGTKTDAPNKPLLIWIQGGPGFAASGIGNFGEIGPLNMDFEPRNHTWVKKGNLLLIDHPVGAGFSYATNDSLYVTTDREMATDLSRAIRMFLRRRKEFRKTPTFIIGQSYGGKICPRLALYLYTAIKNKDLEMNFKGIGIGGGWVNPRESAMMQPDFLYHIGAIDQNLYLEVKKISRQLAYALDKQAYTRAAKLDDLMFSKLNERDFINFNNYNKKMPFSDFDMLDTKVNYFVKPTLRNVNQTIKWSYISDKAYHSLKKTFTMPSYSFHSLLIYPGGRPFMQVETLLNKSNLKVVVYNGNLDVVTPIAGASNWIHKLKWHGADNFSKAERFRIDGVRNGYYKVWDKLSFWWVFGAGHWVPEDNPEAMAHILRYLMSEE